MKLKHNDMDLAMAHSLSKLLITILLCYRSQTFAAHESCGHIGDNSTSDAQHSAYDGDGFYLDIGNQARCNGIVTSWRVCYYRPEESGNGDLHGIKYAVYRKNINGANYIQVSNLTLNFTLGQEQLNNSSQQTHDILFGCSNIPLETPFAVCAGDTIGAWVVDYPDANHSSMHRLNIVSKVNESQVQEDAPIEHLLHGADLYVTSCQMNTTLPAVINISEFETRFSQRPQRLHIRANIMTSK